MTLRRSASSLVAALSLACASARPAPASREPAAAPVELAYADLGSGPPVVLLHGAYGDLRTFGAVIPLVAADRRVVAPSLRYHWPNPWPASADEVYASYTVENHARDVAALVERLAVGPVDLVAHSYGGNVALVLALTRPELARRLVLLEPAVGGMLREVPGGDEILARGAYAGARRDALVARARSGEDPVAVMRALIDRDKPGQLDALPLRGRTELIDNARLVGPYAAHPAFDMPFYLHRGRAHPPAGPGRAE